MPIPIPLRFQAGTLSLGTRQTKQEFYQEMAEKLIAFWDGAIGFVNGGPEPTSNQGPWLRNGNEWRFWNPATGSYSLGVFAAGDIMPIGTATVDPTTGWLLADGASYGTTVYPLLFAAIGYAFGGSGVNFNVPNTKGRSLLGAGAGSGLSLRTIGQTGGVESVVLDSTQVPATPLQGMGGFLTSGLGPGPNSTPIVSSAAGAVPTPSVAGGGLSHPNMHPFIGCQFKIKT